MAFWSPHQPDRRSWPSRP